MLPKNYLPEARARTQTHQAHTDSTVWSPPKRTKARKSNAAIAAEVNAH